MIRWIGILALGLAMLASVASATLADNDLGISPSQKDQLKALAANTRDRTGREREALRAARREMLEAYSTYNMDWRKVKAAMDKISSAQSILLNIHLDNEIALRNILKEDQFKNLREMMRKRVRDRHVLMIVPREADILNRLPNKQMLESLEVPPEKQKQLEMAGDCDKAVANLRQASERLLDLYSNYSLDSAAAKKLINSVHAKQVALLWQQHRRQRVVRQVLTHDQFDKVAQEIQKRLAEREKNDHDQHRGPH